jgi:hypothetical protein
MKVGKQLGYLITLLAMIPMLSGCFFLLGAGAGAAGGYVASEKGYKVQSPVTKEESKKQESK